MPAGATSRPARLRQALRVDAAARRVIRPIKVPTHIAQKVFALVSVYRHGRQQILRVAGSGKSKLGFSPDVQGQYLRNLAKDHEAWQTQQADHALRHISGIEVQGADNFGVSLAAIRDNDGIPDSYEEANGLNPAVDDGEAARLNYVVASGTLVPEPDCVWAVLLLLRRLRR
jgi:hypothetical protein